MGKELLADIKLMLAKKENKRVKRKHIIENRLKSNGHKYSPNPDFKRHKKQPTIEWNLTKPKFFKRLRMVFKAFFKHGFTSLNKSNKPNQ